MKREFLWVIYPLLVIISVRALTLDMSKFNLVQFQDLDILSMLSLSSFAFILLLATVLALTLIYGNRSEIRLATVMIFAVLCITYFLGQYPLLAYWDYYLHGATAKLVLSQSIISSGDYRAYPMPFVLIATTSLITSGGILESMQLLFYASQVLCFIVIYIFTRRYEDERKRAVIVLLATYFVLSFSPDGGRHFSPAQYAFTLFLLFLSPLLTLPRITGTRMALALIFMLAIVMGHPITSVFVFGIICALVLFRRISIQTGLLILTVFLLWQVQVGYNWFGQSYAYFIQTFVLGKGSSALAAQAVPFRELLVYLSPQVLMLTVFKWIAFGAIIIVGLAVAIRYRSDRYMGTILTLFVGLVIGGVVLSVSPYAWIQRMVAPLALVGVLAIGVTLKSTRKQSRSIILLAVLLMPVFISARPPYFIFSAHPHEYEEFVHEWETSVASFANSYGYTPSKGGKQIISTDSITCYIYGFFDSHADLDTECLEAYSNFTSIGEVTPTVFDRGIVIRSTRQELVSYSYANIQPSFWHQVDMNLSDTYMRIYSNGYATVYVKYGP